MNVLMPTTPMKERGKGGGRRPSIGAPGRPYFNRARLMLLTAFFSVSSVATVRLLCADLGDVYSASMEPTIIEGDRVVVNKLAYGVRLPFGEEPFWEWSEPRRGEIVVFRSPAAGRYMIKRVIGLPGDRIRMYRNLLFVNGRRVHYDRPRYVTGELSPRLLGAAPRLEFETIGSITHHVKLTPGVKSPNSFGTVVVPADQFFVMGDNRDMSVDSRAFGFVSGDDILGRVSQVAISLDPENGFTPRLGRFLYPLI
jgi:signal peptidase I